MKIRKKNKQGISLIVLVITIIVMIILAAAVILSLSSNGIINRANQAVSDTDIKQVQTLANTLWSEAYLEQREDASVDIDTYVRTKLAENKIDVDKYVVDITDKGVEVEAKAPLLEEWKESVWDITNDGVPIPKGYVASPYEGEETKSGGLVIYKLTPEEIEDGLTELPEESYETSITTRNQYVWVPIAKEEFKTKFVRKPFCLENDVEGEQATVEAVKLSNEINGEGFWEIQVDEQTNMPLYEENAAYYDSEYFEGFTAKIVEMYESVREHEGFYIGRYEVAFDMNEELTEFYVKSVMGKMPLASRGVEKEDMVGSVLELQRMDTINVQYSSLYGAEQTAMYSVQWDAIIDWLNDTNAYQKKSDFWNYGFTYMSQGGYKTTSSEDLNPGAMFGVYNSSTELIDPKPFEYDENGNVIIDDYDSSLDVLNIVVTTGALKNTKLNNIYDMIGNCDECTLESIRGGSWAMISGNNSAELFTAMRSEKSLVLRGSRETMYIK